MTEVIASNESVVNRYRYTPFGQSMVRNESVYNPYQYTGRHYDEERGNYYYRARIYDQQQSRFLSNDPAGQGANLYAYVGNNPVNRRDPSGTIYIGGPGSPPPRLVDGSVGEMKNNECSNNDNYDSFGSCLNHASYEDCLETCYLVEFNPSYGGGGGGGGAIPEPPEGAECYEKKEEWWGKVVVCNRKATSYLDEVVGSRTSTIGGAVIFGGMGLIATGGNLAGLLGGVEWAYISSTIDHCDEKNQRFTITATWIEPIPYLHCT